MLSQYTPFARKYRPKHFGELLGQEVLVKILSHSIQSNRVFQGYLLSGIRGVGKTTSARIIAKTINCTNVSLLDEIVVPCNQCANCKAISTEQHPDIIEIDAASKTSVEDMRGIIESSEYKPLLGKYKVFIVDEAHMLSRSAFNALLKTLEEPPPHVIFIFATTEIAKMPITVISRCQRYDLRRLGNKEIAKILADIASRENIIIDSASITAIASQSEGSARDAIVTLDKIVSHHIADKEITIERVNQILGLVDSKTIIELIEFVIDAKASQGLNLVAEIYRDSANLEMFLNHISSFVAYLIKRCLNVEGENHLYDLHTEEIGKILSKTNLQKLSMIWQIYSNGISEIKSSYNQLITLEMLVIKSIYAHKLDISEEIVIKHSSEQCPRQY